MTTENKSKLEQVYTHKKWHQKWSSIESDEFLINAYNSNLNTQDIAKQANAKFGFKVNPKQIRRRLAQLRIQGLDVDYRHRVKSKKAKRTPKTAPQVENLLARIGAMLRFNDSSKELIDRYVLDAVKEAVKHDLEKLDLT